jgi:hypothetical protein
LDICFLAIEALITKFNKVKTSGNMLMCHLMCSVRYNDHGYSDFFDLWHSFSLISLTEVFAEMLNSEYTCFSTSIHFFFHVALLENLTARVKAWEKEKGIPFMHDKATSCTQCSLHINWLRQFHLVICIVSFTDEAFGYLRTIHIWKTTKGR